MAAIIAEFVPFALEEVNICMSNDCATLNFLGIYSVSLGSMGISIKRTYDRNQAESNKSGRKNGFYGIARDGVRTGSPMR